MDIWCDGILCQAESAEDLKEWVESSAKVTVDYTPVEDILNEYDGNYGAMFKACSYVEPSIPGLG